MLSEVYDALAAVAESPGTFDLAFVTWGIIGWLPDVQAWAGVVAHFLRPGGALYFADGHPTALVFDDLAGPGDAQGCPAWLVPYFDTGALVLDDLSDYSDPDAGLANSRTVQWMHPLSRILEVLRGAGLRLDWLHEHPAVTWPYPAASSALRTAFGTGPTAPGYRSRSACARCEDDLL